MKNKLLLATLMLATFVSAETKFVTTLCPKTIMNETTFLWADSPSYIKGASGVIYKAGYCPVSFPDSATHTNVSVEVLGTFLPTLPTLGKSVSIHGLTDPTAFLLSIGAVRCDSDGNEFEGIE